MTSHVAIANAPDSDHDIRINVRQAGAQTEWVVPPGKQTVLTLYVGMDIRIAEGEPNQIVIEVDGGPDLVAIEGMVDSRPRLTVDAEDEVTLSGDACVGLSRLEHDEPLDFSDGMIR